MERYYFKMDAELSCTERCDYFSIENYGSDDTVNIGSLACKQCEHNISFCGEESWIKCEVYSAFLELKLLREENNNLKEQLKEKI